MALVKPQKYTKEARKKKGLEYARHLDSLVGLKGKRILEVGPHLGDLSVVLAEDFGCEVVGLDPRTHGNWPDLQRRHPSIRMVHGDIAAPPNDLADNSFDLVVSFVVWEHIRHPFSALSHCQRLLKPSGKKFLRANLYRSAVASHLYNELDTPWPHLLFSPRELREKLRRKRIGWSYWVNKLTYQQYLFYFRKLGFYISHEKFWNASFNDDFYQKKERVLGLYPKWDLETDFFEVVLEFDDKNPKTPIDDPVYSKLENSITE